MKKISGILLVLLAFKNTSAQCDSSFFRNTGTFIYDLLLLDSSKIIGVGDNGYVIKSTNGGISWRNIPTFQPYFLKSICAASDSILYSVGYYKTILKSENQGETWYPLYAKLTSGFTNISSFFNDVFFLTRDKGFIVGDDAKLVTTTDGGRSWKDTTISTVSSSRLNCITFVNDTLGFICGGSNTLFRTKNGGSSWEKINMDFLGFNRNIIKVKFINQLVGFGVGDNGIFIRTIDGGSTWTSPGTPTGSGSNYNDLFFYDSQTGFIAGTYSVGTILKTTDGGTTWNVQNNSFDGLSSCYTLATDPNHTKIVFAGGGSSGDFLGYNGRNIISTIDSGASYRQLSANSRISYNDVFFLNDSTGFITGNNKAYKTSDYGESWKPLSYVPSLLSNPSKNIFFLNEQNGFVVSDRIYKTSDGGATWNLTGIPGGQPQFFATRIYFFDTLTGVVMDNGTVYRTTNGGSTWSLVLSQLPGSFFRDFFFTPSGKGFLVGYNGTVFVTSDQGATWSPFDLNTTHYLTSVYFRNSMLGFIGTADSLLFRTTDGGMTWSNYSIGNFSEMRAFLLLNDTLGYMIRNNSGGGGSGIYKTKNGGLTWIFINSVLENLYRIAGFNTVYTAGGNGFIFKTDHPVAPGIPGYIYGPTLHCQNTKSSFFTGLLQGVNYNWQLSGGGTNTFTQNLDTVLWNNSGTYNLSVSVSNACGTGPTRQTSVLVYPATTIITPPSPQTACFGTPVTFSVAASGSSLTYQWLKGANPIAGATNSTYSISAVALSDSGNYSVVVTGLCGTLTSASGKLTVLLPGNCTTAVSSVSSPVVSADLLPSLLGNNAVLKVIATRNVKTDWMVLDLDGRVITTFSHQLFRGENLFNLSMGYLSSGIYFIRGSIKNSTFKVIRFEKIF